jgi:hypothetical protein
MCSVAKNACVPVVCSNGTGTVLQGCKKFFLVGTGMSVRDFIIHCNDLKIFSTPFSFLKG